MLMDRLGVESRREYRTQTAGDFVDLVFVYLPAFDPPVEITFVPELASRRRCRPPRPRTATRPRRR